MVNAMIDKPFGALAYVVVVVAAVFSRMYHRLFEFQMPPRSPGRIDFTAFSISTQIKMDMELANSDAVEDQFCCNMLN